ASASIRCTHVFFELRKTLSRGRWAVPCTLARTRRWRFSRSLTFSSMFCPHADGFPTHQPIEPRLGACYYTFLLLPALAAGFGALASLAAHLLAAIADAFALVRLGLSNHTELGGGLTYQLFIDPLNNNERYAGGCFNSGFEFDTAPGRIL